MDVASNYAQAVDNSSKEQDQCKLDDERDIGKDLSTFSRPHVKWSTLTSAAKT